MTTALRKALALLLALTLLLCAAPLAFAQGEEESPACVTVDFIFSSKELTVCLPYLYVEDGIAEHYGFAQSETDHTGKPVDGITVLDAIVAAHAAYYGDDVFTPDSAKEYLTYAGYLTGAFGLKTSALGFAVNGRMPHDDVMASWGYTGYAADTAVLAEDDSVNLFALRDTKNYADMLPVVTLSGKDGTGEVTVSATGYIYYSFSAMDEETIAANTFPLAGADVYEFNWEGGENKKLGTLDADGKLTVAFTQSRDYAILVGGEFEHPEAGTLPIATGMARIHVEAPTYEVKFSANGGEFEDGITFYSYSREAGEAYEIPADPTREGYTFTGWDPAPDGVTPDHDITFQAQWEKNEDEAPNFLQRVLNAIKGVLAKLVGFFRALIARLSELFK